MDIKIYGKFCDKHYELINNTKKALTRTGIKSNIEIISKQEKIFESGVQYMPSLMVNGKLVLSGEAGTVDELVSILSKNS